MWLLHIGDHTGFTLRQLATHVLEPDHLAFATITALVGICAYRYGRRVEARMRIEGDRYP